MTIKINSSAVSNGDAFTVVKLRRPTASGQILGWKLSPVVFCTVSQS